MKRDELDEVLRMAIQNHFCKLFDVLMADPTEKGIARFKTGLRNLAEMESAVATIIEKGKH